MKKLKVIFKPNQDLCDLHLNMNICFFNNIIERRFTQHFQVHALLQHLWNIKPWTLDNKIYIFFFQTCHFMMAFQLLFKMCEGLSFSKLIFLLKTALFILSLVAFLFFCPSLSPSDSV